MPVAKQLRHAEISALLHSIQTSLWKADVWALRCLIELEKTEGMKASRDDLRKLATELVAIINKVRHLREELDRV